MLSSEDELESQKQIEVSIKQVELNNFDDNNSISQVLDESLNIPSNN